MQKIFLSADQLLDDAFTLGFRVIDSGYRPDFVLAVWRGGTPVAVAIQELLAWRGIANDHMSIRSRHYSGIDSRLPSVRVDGLEPVLATLKPENRVLIVDDVFDTGLSIRQIVTEIEAAYHGPSPEIRVATPWFKPDHNKTDREPDFYLHTTSDWLVFPHELAGLDNGEILAHKPGLTSLKQRLDND